MTLDPIEARQGITELAVVAVMWDESRDLHEWLEFHLLVGVERFFLYSDGPVDAATKTVLMPYVARGEVILHDWFEDPPQLRAYQHALIHFGDTTKWMAFIDCDEFLWSPKGLRITEALKPLERYAGVAVNWSIFGTSGIGVRTAPVVESFTWRALSDDSRNHHVKSIVQPRRMSERVPSDPHYFQPLPGLTIVNENGLLVDGPLSREVHFDHLRINHYWSKSISEAKRKSERPRADNRELRRVDEMLSDDLNQVHDTELRDLYGAALRRRMECER